MFPYSDYPRAVGSFPEAVPVPTGEPGEGSQVCVQFNVTWLPYVLGSLQQLLLQSTWDTADPDAIKSVQGSAFDLIAIVGNSINYEDCVIPQFRMAGCTLQVSTDGGATWTNLVDLSTCTVPGPPGPTGPTGPSGPPYAVSGPGNLPETPTTAPQTCNTFNISGSGSQQSVAPVAISPGFTIRVYDLSGAASDGSVSLSTPIPAFSGADISPWFCPTGQHYALGSCYGGTTVKPADPLPTAPHMCLIMSLGGTLYDVSGGDTTITVPAGVSGVLPMFQLNDSDISDNKGNFAFKVDICNATDCPSGSEWSHTFDLLGSSSGFADAGNGSSWVSGSGWTGGSSGAGSNIHGDAFIKRLFTSAEVTQVIVTVTRSSVGGANQADNFVARLGATNKFINGSSPSAGTHDKTYTFDQTIDSITIDFNSGTTGTQTFISKVIICGKGTEPDWSA